MLDTINSGAQVYEIPVERLNEELSRLCNGELRERLWFEPLEARGALIQTSLEGIAFALGTILKKYSYIEIHGEFSERELLLGIEVQGALPPKRELYNFSDALKSFGITLAVGEGTFILRFSYRTAGRMAIYAPDDVSLLHRIKIYMEDL